MQQVLLLSLVLSMLLFSGSAGAAGDAKTKSFYKGPALFSTRPSEAKSLQTIDRFGPVGMGIELHRPAFVMKIKNIEEGSPAEATGKLKKGQTIETINGQRLADVDPRIQLGQIVATAEASDGVLKFMVRGKPDAKVEEVIVKIPVLGVYSKTWPLDCPKSDKTAALAFTMAAAASLTPDGENSLYARARDVSAVKSFYTTSFMLHGHTGGDFLFIEAGGFSARNRPDWKSPWYVMQREGR